MLVSLAIVAVLMGILLPSLGRVREIARQTVCASNARQLGLGIEMFASGHHDYLPMSQFLDPNSPFGGRSVDTQQRRMVLLRFPHTPQLGAGRRSGQWDGVGKLFEEHLLTTPAVFYCPSHRGEHPLERYADRFDVRGTTEIISNYQYRGQGPNGQRRLFQLNGSVALVADALAGEDYFNHTSGFNVLVVDGSVNWFADPSGSLSTQLANTATAENDTAVGDTWGQFDGVNNSAP